MSDQYAELRCPKCGRLYETDGAKSCCWEPARPADTVADGGSASKSDVEPDQHADDVAVLQAIATEAYEAWLDAQSVEQKALRAYQAAFSDVVQARIRKVQAARNDGTVCGG